MPTQVRQHCGRRTPLRRETEFATTNSLYSLWMARPLLFDGCVVLNCDVLFHPQLLHDLLTARHDAALMLAHRRPDDPPFGDEEMKVKVRGGRVVDMSKAMDPAESDGENVGMLRFDAARCAAAGQKLEQIVGAGGRRDWAPRAFAAFAAERPLYAIRYARVPWTEIDFPEDYSARCATSFRRSRGCSVGPRGPVASLPRVGRCGRPVSDVRTLLPTPRASVRAQPRSGLPVSEPRAPGGARAICATASRARPGSS